MTRHAFEVLWRPVIRAGALPDPYLLRGGELIEPGDAAGWRALPDFGQLR